MSKKLPYEESVDQQLNDLPLPDGEQSWQKMKQLLEDEDKGRRILDLLAGDLAAFASEMTNLKVDVRSREFPDRPRDWRSCRTGSFSRRCRSTARKS